MTDSFRRAIEDSEAESAKLTIGQHFQNWHIATGIDIFDPTFAVSADLMVANAVRNALAAQAKGP